MKFGIVLSWVNPHEALQLAQAAEEAGWDGVFTWDGIAFGETPVFDPWVLMGAIAGVTERVTIGAMILPLARRRPWKVAKEAVTIDHLSHGRLVLPVGLGATDDAAFTRVSTDSPDRKVRAERLDETLEILALAQSGEKFSWDGKHYQASDLQFAPRPVQDRIPIWAVAAWPKEKSLARAARWDGIIPVDMSPGKEPFTPVQPDVVRDIVAWMTDHRDGQPFDVVLEGKTSGPDDTETINKLADAGGTWFIESRWDESENFDSLLARIRLGPPRLG